MLLISSRPCSGARTQWSFSAQPNSPGQARRRLDELLDGWGVPPADRWPALMVTSELASNAVEHARTPFRLAVTRTGDDLLIEVRDESDAEPQLTEPTAATRRGRGLHVIRELSDRFSWSASSDGKTIWAIVPLRAD